MVFNFIFHLIWYTVKVIVFLRGQIVTTEEDPNRPVPPTATTATMRVAIRPRADVKKLFVAFGVSFLIVHQLIISVTSPPSRMTAGAKKCVEIEKNSFFCTDDIEEARRRARKTAQYYLSNFGVVQTIEGSGEENIKMRVVHADMEQYLKRWIVTYDHIESLKEKCINKHDKCVFWASIGECKKNPGYMENDCMLACQKCEKLLETPESNNEF